MHPRILIIDHYYPEFLEELYAADPALGDLDFEQQRRRLLATGFGVGDAYSHGLGVLGCEAKEIICNADRAQERWAVEHRLPLPGNIHDRRRRILAAQIEEYRPEVLYVFEWSPLGDSFLAEIRSRVRLVVGQIASPLPPNRTFAGYHLMISSWPPIVEHFRGRGIAAEPLELAFDQRVLRHEFPWGTLHDVTFIGGLAPSHPDRTAFLERLMRDVQVDVYGYGWERVSADSPIRARLHGPVWGWRMYETLRRSKVTINRHARIDVDGRVVTNLATNMRLYEATGMGTCLITEAKENLDEMFDPGREVVTYENDEECVEKIRYYLKHERQRTAVATAGQERTLRDHTYAVRMEELLEVLREHLMCRPTAKTVSRGEVVSVPNTWHVGHEAFIQ